MDTLLPPWVRRAILILGGAIVLSACHSDPHSHPQAVGAADGGKQKEWLAGDHHIHSQYSVGWDAQVSPPAPILAGDAIYSASKIAEQAHRHGLSWMVITDHGGPNHSQINLEQAYPDLLDSRTRFPDLIQFYGMEFDTPGARHSSLIIPYSKNEANQLFELERNFNRREAFPEDPERLTEEKMLEALQAMSGQTPKPVLFANHPGRSATDLGEYTDVTPAELRRWNDVAPDVAIGMEGAPGHQAATLMFDGSIRPSGRRGGYKHYPTMGGFDQMTARVGGFWDSMLGEGRRWWITANSDSHVHYTDGKADFWPGEYSKTFVFAERNYDSILDGLRAGRVFVATGDLIDALTIELTAENGARAGMGETLSIGRGEQVTLTLRFRDPDEINARGHRPAVARVDLIQGDFFVTPQPLENDENPSTHVSRRFYIDDWYEEGDYSRIDFTLAPVMTSGYVRVRGTANSDELEPRPDPAGENPWSDLWFYSNPVFVEVIE